MVSSVFSQDSVDDRRLVLRNYADTAAELSRVIPVFGDNLSGLIAGTANATLPTETSILRKETRAAHAKFLKELESFDKSLLQLENVIFSVGKDLGQKIDRQPAEELYVNIRAIHLKLLEEKQYSLEAIEREIGDEIRRARAMSQLRKRGPTFAMALIEANSLMGLLAEAKVLSAGAGDANLESILKRVEDLKQISEDQTYKYVEVPGYREKMDAINDAMKESGRFFGTDNNNRPIPWYDRATDTYKTFSEEDQMLYLFTGHRTNGAPLEYYVLELKTDPMKYDRPNSAYWLRVFTEDDLVRRSVLPPEKNVIDVRYLGIGDLETAAMKHLQPYNEAATKCNLACLKYVSAKNTNALFEKARDGANQLIAALKKR